MSARPWNLDEKRLQSLVQRDARLLVQDWYLDSVVLDMRSWQGVRVARALGRDGGSVNKATRCAMRWTILEIAIRRRIEVGGRVASSLIFEMCSERSGLATSRA